MDFIQHTLNWCRGEIFEGKLLAFYGLAIIIISFLFWKLGSTPLAKKMFIPMLVVGLFCAAIGSGLITNNNKRIIAYQKSYAENPAQFVRIEKERTDNFIKGYPYTRYIMAAIIISGLGCHLIWSSPWPRTIGLSLILLALSALFIDHFSEERADTYHQKIIEELKRNE